MIAALAAAVALTAASGSFAPIRRALVVAYNGPEDPGFPALRFADDDGIRWAETLDRLGFAVTLLTVPDADTARAGAPQLVRARPPTIGSLEEAVRELGEAITADRAAGLATDMIVVFVGHGRTDEAGRPYLVLLDGKLDRAALYRDVVDPLRAGYVHLLVDACHAAGVVGGRGEADVAVLRQLQGALELEQLSSRTTVGAMFAESDDGQTHEWSRIRSGVFSHAVRSGLLGAADVNGDGRVEYSELDAFVAAALAKVTERRARLYVRTRAPAQDPRRPLIPSAPPGARLELLPGEPPERFSVEDESGNRLADVHRARDERVLIALPERPWYWIRTPEGDARIAAAELPHPPKTFGQPELASRGPAEESLHRGLFVAPFNRAFYEGYVASRGQVAVEFPQRVAAVAPVVQPAGPATPPAGAAGRGWTIWPDGLELGVTIGTAPVVPGAMFGASAAWRTSGEGSAVRFGARASFGAAEVRTALVGAAAFPQKATVSRITVQGLATLEGPWPVSPWLDLGVGWALVAIGQNGVTQGDAGGGAIRLATGLVIRPRKKTLRLGLSLGIERYQVDGEAWPFVTGGLEASFGF